eukprot:3599621-Amphidinium_carterae.1
MAFAGKSVATLRKRRSSLEMWGKFTGSELSVPFCENDLFSHMCELKRISAPATRAQSLLEAVKFAHGML